MKVSLPKIPILGSLWAKLRLFIGILYNQMNVDHTFSLASALTYKTLFSLIPIFVLSLLMLSSINVGEGSNALDAAVRKIMFEQLTLDKFPLTDQKGHPMLDDAGQPVMLSQYIESFVDKARGAVNTRFTGLIAFAILLYGSLSLMSVIEGAFNTIYGTTGTRSWPHRIMLYWCVLTMGPLGIAVSMVLGDTVFSKATTLIGSHGWIVASMQRFVGLFVSFLLVVLMYRIIPGTRVKWRSALIGGAVGAIAWETCKWAFSFYIHWSVQNPNWYGSLALLPLFMLWIYLTWCSILIGLHIAYMDQYYPLLKRRYHFIRMGRSALSDLRTVLPLGVLLYRRFKQGKSLRVSDASEALLIPADAATQLFQSLEDAGIVQVGLAGRYTLARPPESISAHDLLTAVRTPARIPPELIRQQSRAGGYPQIKALTELEALETTWAKAHSLPALADEKPEASSQ
ncbi:MAG: YihY family inner membrane protein [Phycisphaerales bacterium]|nr:YihY family inner membrane protein [Phycisphaerales bacterium]